jgi:thioredoxin-like negative regulator of GroEL
VTEARRTWLAALAVVVAVVAVLGGVATVGFIWLDDALYVTRNPQVLAGLTRRGLAWAFGFGDDRSTYFHPVTWLSLMADLQLFGLSPVALHLENLALHALSAVLLFLTACRMTGRRWPSLGAAVLFGLHPLTVEAVAWIAERKSVLALALGMGAVHLWVAHLARPARWRVAAAVALFAASLLARPQLVVLPGLLLLLDLWPLGRLAPFAAPDGRFAPAPLRRLLLEKWPFAVTAAAVAGLVLRTLPDTSTTGEALPPLGFRVAQAVASIADYAGAVVWPVGLAIVREQPDEVTAFGVARGAAVLLVVTAATLVGARRRPWLLFGWLWFLTALTPALGLVQSGLWPAWADRFAYAPLLGLSLGVAFGVADLAERWPRARRLLLAASAAALLSLALATRAQVDLWQSSVALFQRASAQAPRSANLRTFYASTLLNVGRYPEALAELAEAIRLDPGFQLARLRVGDVHHRAGRPRSAALAYRDALQVDPDDPDTNYALGQLAWEEGWTDEARFYLERFLALEPVERPAEVAAARVWLQGIAARPAGTPRALR